MAKNEIVSTTSAAGGAPEGGSGVKAAVDALLRAVGVEHGIDLNPANVANVQLVDRRVTVEYLDKASATRFDPLPVKHITSSIK